MVPGYFALWMKKSFTMSLWAEFKGTAAIKAPGCAAASVPHESCCSVPSVYSTFILNIQEVSDILRTITSYPDKSSPPSYTQPSSSKNLKVIPFHSPRKLRVLPLTTLFPSQGWNSPVISFIAYMLVVKSMAARKHAVFFLIDNRI